MANLFYKGSESKYCGPAMANLSGLPVITNSRLWHLCCRFATTARLRGTAGLWCSFSPLPSWCESSPAQDTQMGFPVSKQCFIHGSGGGLDLESSSSFADPYTNIAKGEKKMKRNVEFGGWGILQF